jgi:hypothetical protein
MFLSMCLLLSAVSIPRLLSIVNPLISSGYYQQLRYTTVTPMMGSVRVR